MKYISIGAYMAKSIADAVAILRTIEIKQIEIKQHKSAPPSLYPGVPHIDLSPIPHSLRNLKFIADKEDDE